jgi:hypothetical protein
MNAEEDIDDEEHKGNKQAGGGFNIACSSSMTGVGAS